jgi:hypothetical protein
MTSPLGDAPANSIRKCQRCHKKLPLSDFPLKVKGAKRGSNERTKACRICGPKKSLIQRAKRGRDLDKENLTPRHSGADSGASDADASDASACADSHAGSSRAHAPSTPPTDLPTFLSYLRIFDVEDDIDLEVNISCPELASAGGLRERGDALAKLVWERTGYKFKCVNISLLLPSRCLIIRTTDITVNMS